MTEIFTRTYRGTDKGDIIQIPDDARTQVERVGSQKRPDVIIEVIGGADTSEHVVLHGDADGATEVPDESRVLGIDPWHEHVW